MANGTFELGQINITSPNGLVTKPISIDNNGKPLFDNVELASTVNPIFTGNVSLPSTTTVNSKLLANSLLAEYTVTGSAVTSIDFSGLDINTHKSYRIEMEWNNITASYSYLYLFINNDLTLTNYYNQYIVGENTALSGLRTNSPRIAGIGGQNVNAVFGNLQLSYGYPIGLFQNIDRVNSNVVAMLETFNKITTISNITQLTFTTSVAGAIGVGSKVRIYRGDV